MKRNLKRLVPPALLGIARDTYLGMRRLPATGSAYLHPWRRESIARLTVLQGASKGRRAFIIGNGPSLRDTDLSPLRQEFTFGLNRIYLMFPSLGFETSCLVSVNDLVIEQCVREMQSLDIPRYFSWRSRRFVPGSASGSELPTFLYTTYESPTFARDARGRLWEGATVTYVALQLAFHMGFQQVILIGVDHSFTTQGQANRTVISDGADPNHFSPAYFGKGFRWQLPDLETSELAYSMARDAYRRAGREVLDATVGGRLTVFPKADYNSLFA
ncbi:MAG TPA: 6-hydroxymethylpterin diphosphokinase MptE-like protein [Anaerolineales bacterium]